MTLTLRKYHPTLPACPKPHSNPNHNLTLTLYPRFLGSARIEVVRFVGCVGLAKFLAPGRNTYGSVWSAAFQPCKKRAKILKWRQIRAFSNYVSEWCGRAVAARLLRRNRA